MPFPKITAAEQAERDRVGATVRELREARGLRSGELASAIGISRPYLANIEAGRKPLTKILAARVAHSLNVRQAALVHAGYFAEGN